MGLNFKQSVKGVFRNLCSSTGAKLTSNKRIVGLRVELTLNQ